MDSPYNTSDSNNRTIQALKVMEPASKCTDSQYIALRSIALREKKPGWFFKNLNKYELKEAKEKEVRC